MTAHTPGPWTVKEFYGSEGHVVMAGNCHVAEVFGIKEHCSRDAEALPNAHLIAAAPDLLALVEKALRIHDDPTLDLAQQDDALDAWALDARHALSRARGEVGRA